MNSHINIQESIATQRLVYKRSWIETIDTVVYVLLSIALMIGPISAYFFININTGTNRVLAFFVFPLIILISLYSIYRKLRENSLTAIETSLNQHKNKKYLIDFLNKRGFEHKENKEIVTVISEHPMSFNNIWTSTTTFIVVDRTIYFNIVKNYPRLNPPVFFSHLTMKKDLSNYFKDKE